MIDLDRVRDRIQEIANRQNGPGRAVALAFHREWLRLPETRRIRIRVLVDRRKQVWRRCVCGWARLVVWTLLLLSFNTFLAVTTTDGCAFCCAVFVTTFWFWQVQVSMKNMPRPPRWSWVKKGIRL